jgi:hypothetical protein
MNQSRKIMSGLLAPNTSFRIYVTGEFGAKELVVLLSKLQIDREILKDDVENSPISLHGGRGCR